MADGLPTLRGISYRLFSEDEFLMQGLEFRSNGVKKSQQKCKKESLILDFKSIYGVHPAALCLIWVDLQTTPFESCRIDDSVSTDELLIVYRWLKSYESAKALSTNFSMTIKDIRRVCRELPYKIASLRKLKVSDTSEGVSYFFCIHLNSKNLPFHA